MWFPIPKQRPASTHRGTPTGRNRRRRRKSFQAQHLQLEILEARELLNGSSAVSDQLQAAYGQIPLSFEANQGQTDAQVRFLARGQGYGLFLTGTDAVLSLAKGSAADAGSANVLDLRLTGANPNPQVSGEEPLAGVSNYLRGNDPTQWHTNVATYSKVRYRNVYPGIDLVYYGNQRQLEYDFVVSPGADPGAIQIAFQGAQGLTLTDAGDLVLHASGGDVVEHAPVLYQDGPTGRVAVAGRYVLMGADEAAFQVGAYDPSRPLVIDPVLGYSTYLGGSSTDSGKGIAVDAAGNAYVVGYTLSTNFPTTTGALQTSLKATENVFVTKLNASGTAALYSTYLGGSGRDGDAAAGIAVDGAGNAYVTGYTYTTDFPTTAGAFQRSLQGRYNAFVAKLNASGTALVYSTYLGGSGGDQGYGIAVDGSGNVYITGSTLSTNFPTTAGAFQRTHGGINNDAFVAELNPNLSGSASLVYSTYLGGGNDDISRGIAVDGSGNAYVTGQTSSIDFPTTAGAFQRTRSDGYDAFVSKLNASGSALVFSTYLGGSGNDGANGIAVDSAGNAYVTGGTTSTNFPTTAGAFQGAYGGGSQDAFVAKLNAPGSALLYSTYLGGSADDAGQGIAVDGAGNAYVTGSTNSINFPIIAGAVQATKLADTSHESGFVTKLNASGTALLYSTYLGGNLADSGRSIAVDAFGNAYVTGYTNSANFPTTAGAFQTTYQGGQDAFVAKIVNYPTHFAVSAPASTGAGDTFAFIVTALDAGNNPVPNYTGTVHFTSTDAQALLPADYTFTPADNGSHAFVASLRSAGGYTLRVSDTAVASVVGQADSVTEFAVTGRVVNNSGTAGITFNQADGNYWFTELDASLIGRITPSGTVTEFNFLPASAHPNDIYATPQGVLYFDEADGFGQYDTRTQQYTPHPTPGHGTGYGFALAVDGNIWFPEYAANKITRFNPGTRAITEFTVPTANSGPTGIVAGPDNNVWFTEFAGNKIGRINPAAGTDQQIQQSVTEFAVPTLNGQPYGITAGSDGNFWFAEQNSDRIGRINPTGAVTDFLIPSANAGPVGITAGPDGNVWFTEGNAGRIGQITPTGVIAEFVLPNPRSAPYRIASGPDGNLWFTEDYGNKIGRLTPTITVTPAPPVTHFSVGAVTGTTAGSPFSVTVVALDANNNVVPAYAGKVHFSSTDPQALLPADYTFTPSDRGIHIFTNVVALKSAGYQTLTVTDTASNTLTGAAIVLVSPAAASTLMVSSFPSPTTAGVAGTFTVTAKDAYGNIATGYIGTVAFQTSDPQAMLPGPYTFTAADMGVHTFTATFKTVGTYTLRAADTATSTIAGQQTGIVVNAAAASQFQVAAPPSVTAGTAFAVTATVKDPYGNVATGYTGTACVSAPADSQAMLPPCYTFTAGDNGVHTFTPPSGVTLKTAGAQILQVDGGSVHGGTLVNVTPAAAASFTVSGFPSPSTAGVPGMVTVTAKDLYGNVATGYRGTVHFTSSDPQATAGNGLPADYAFTAADNGVHTFSATLKTAGTQSLTATDTVSAMISGSQTGISVTPAAASRLTAALPTAVVQGIATRLTVTLLDAFGNVATGYRGTVHVTAPTDSQAILPPDYTFTAADNGVHTPAITFLGRGSQNAVITDTGSLMGVATTTAGAMLQPAATYAVGATPASVIAADLNGDGVLDLVMANGAAGTVTVLLGNGDGSFQTAAVYPAGADAAAVVVGDFNGDGLPDLAVVNTTTNTVSILLGNGDGSFQAPIAVSVGAQPVAIVAADLNGDGVLDLVTANAGDNTLSVLLGNGDGSFQAAVAVPAGVTPAALAVADLNGDGVPDLVVAGSNGSAGQVSVLLGNGDGSFQPPTTYAVGVNPVAVAVGDLNGDGIPDVVTANANGHNVSVLLGVGDGTFQPAQVYAAGMQPSAVAIADLNGDGLPDLVVTDAAGNQVDVLLGVGDGSFRAPMTFATGNGPSSVAVGDFNGDGNLDVAVTNQADGSVSVLLRTASPTGAPDRADRQEPGVARNATFGRETALGIELGLVERLRHQAVDDLFAVGLAW